MRKSAAIILVIACLGAGVIFIAVKRSDVHHTAERRLWKNRAIAAIENDLKDHDHLKKRFGEIPKPRGEFDTAEPEWKTADTIVCIDSSWLAYRAQCNKVDPKVHDIFIAKASDGTWYFSDYHFCIDMLMLEVQPRSLVDFRVPNTFWGSSTESPTRRSIPHGFPGGNSAIRKKAKPSVDYRR